VPAQHAGGRTVLDEHEPGWHERIDRNSLDLSSPHSCILGQIYREETGEFAFLHGWLRLCEWGTKGPTFFHGWENGVESGAFCSNAARPYWRQQITSRRVGAVNWQPTDSARGNPSASQLDALLGEPSY